MTLSCDECELYCEFRRGSGSGALASQDSGHLRGLWHRQNSSESAHSQVPLYFPSLHSEVCCHLRGLWHRQNSSGIAHSQVSPGFLHSILITTAASM